MSRPDIRPVLKHYGFDDLPTTLGWRSVRCKFHPDRNASARYISFDDEQAFKCNACSASGDVISLVKQQESLDYKEALAFLEEITGEQVGAGTMRPKERYKPVRIGDSASAPTNPQPTGRRRRRRLSNS